MNPIILVYITYGAILLFVAGMILMKFHEREIRENDQEWTRFLHGILMPDIRDILTEIMSESMDMIPEKLKDIRQKIERGE